MAFSDMRGTWSQRDQRRAQMFKDQHGRSYHATIELKSGDPCGLIEHRYTAPLVVPSMYLEKSRDPERPYDLHINYDRWLQDIDTERAGWEKEARQRSMKLYGDKYDARDAFTTEVLEIVGPPPQAREPVLAAKQGNPWVLGFVDTPDRRLVQYFEPAQLPEGQRRNEPDFSSLETSEDLNDQYDPDALGGTKPRRSHHKAKAGAED